MRFTCFQIILSLVLWSQPSAAEDGFEYSETIESTNPDSVPAPLSSPLYPEEPSSEPQYKSGPEKRGPPARFDLSDRDNFRSWINDLCELAAVSTEESARLRVHDHLKTEIHATNKQGSLQLMLENYVDDLNCEANPRICQKSRRFSSALDSWKASAAQRKEKREAREKALKSEFYKLRDIEQLNGKAKSIDVAKEILLALKKNSRCRIRAVQSRRQK